MLTIEWDNTDPILTLKRANLASQRLRPRDNAMAPEKFHRLLLADHSTLRFLNLLVFDDDCPYTVANQMVRHTKDHCQPVMSSGRPDWNDGAQRDYTQSRWYFEKFTPGGLIKAMEQRRCFRAEEATQKWAGKLIRTMRDSDCQYIREIAKECKPKCIKSHFCDEENGCGMWPQREYVATSIMNTCVFC